jgi:hypothetical protein
MGERNAEQAHAQRRDFDTYVKTVAADAGGGAASEIEKAKQLLDSGAISQEEYDRLKQRALA